MYSIDEWIRETVKQCHRSYLNYGIDTNELINVGHETFLEGPRDIEKSKALIKSAINNYIYEIKKHSNHRDINADKDLMLNEYGPNPFNIIADEEKIEEIQELLSRLSQRQRLILEAIFLKDPPKTLQEIADQLKISKQRVGILKQKALESLYVR